MLPSSVASSEQAALVIDLTQTASALLLAIEGQTTQSSGSDDDGTQF